MNVLVTSAGRRVKLVQCFQKELKALCGPNSMVMTTDLNTKLSAACAVSDKCFDVGRFRDDDYMPKLLELCLAHDLRMVVPTIDTELRLYATHRTEFLKHGIDLVISDEGLVSQCRDKRLTNSLFETLGLRTPRIFSSKEELSLPAFVKPIDGSSSQNLFVIRSMHDFRDFMADQEKFIMMEYLDPEDHIEYTIDIYFDRNGVQRCAVPRVRLATRSGEVCKGITKRGRMCDFVADKFAEIPGFRGCITLQAFMNNRTEDIYGIEINPRFGGGYTLSYAAGANYVQWLIREYLLEQSIPSFSNWEDELLFLRYDDEVLIRNAAV